MKVKNKILQYKLQHWLSQRFQYQQPKKLKQNDVLVFMHQQGFLYLVLILITFIAGVNYANNLILAFCFLMSAILSISFYLTFKQLHALQVEIILPEIARAHSLFKVQVVFKQDSKAPKYLYIKHKNQTQKILLNNLQDTVTLEFMTEQRGLYPLPHIQLYSTYPFGLVRAWTYFYVANGIWVAPQAIAFKRGFQQCIAKGQADFDEFHDLRRFKIGDALQAVSWKQVARGQGMYVKQFEDQAEPQRVSIDYTHMPSAQHEEKLSMMMALVDQCEQHNTQYNLQLPQFESGFGCGTKHYLHVQQHLAQA